MLISAYKWNRTVLTFCMGWLISCSPKAEFDSIITSVVDKKDYVDEVIISGTLEAINTRSYSCRSLWSEATIQFLIKEGSFVFPGDTLCILEASELENQYFQALNELEQAKAAYNKSEADLALQYLLLEAEVRNIEATTEISRLDSLQMEFTSPSSREIIGLDLRKAEVEKNMKLKKLEFLKQINDSELQKMKLRIDQQQNQVEKAKSQLDNLTLTSTGEGVVVYAIHWESGSKVREGDGVWEGLPIIKIPDLTSMQVKLEVIEADYRRLEKDQTMLIRVDAFPDIELTGNIKFKAPVGKPFKRNSEVKLFEVIASLDSTSFSIQPGLAVTCNVLVNHIEDTIVVPVVSLFDEDSIRVVYIAEENQFKKRKVSVSEYNNKEAIITAGLSAGESFAMMKPPESLIQKN